MMTASLRKLVLAGFGAALLLSPLAAEAQGRPGACAPYDRHCSQPAHPSAKPGPQRPTPSLHAAPVHKAPPPQHAAPGYRPHPAAPRPHHYQAPPRPHPAYAVRPGQSAKNAQRFNRGKHSRFAAPPRGQEYRVVNNHLVLADSKTLKVVAVMGLLNQLLK